MLRVGVTGGIGSGKSTVCRMLAAYGIPVFDADAEGKRLMATDPSLIAAIKDHFGAESYSAEGVLDRSYLAGRVFGDAEALARLNDLVHPRVYQAFQTFVDGAAARGDELVVLESAILLQSGGAQHVDYIVLVDAPEEVRLSRVVRREAITPEAVLARMAHQARPEVMVGRANQVLLNDGTEAELQRKVAALRDVLLGAVRVRRS